MNQHIEIFWNTYKKVINASLFSGLFLLVLVVISSTPPSDFPQSDIVSIRTNTGISQTAGILKERHIIRSAFLYKVWSILLGGGGKIIAGDYLFNKPQSVIKVASRIVEGTHGIPKVKVTIIEGLNVKEIALSLSKSLINFDTKGFIAQASPFEGYLFPDTYFFYQNVKPIDVISVMKDTFEAKTKSLEPLIVESHKNKKDIITLASIVEREATSTIDRKIISGILWKRLAKGMALQVDPPFYYLLGKDSPDITRDDLKIDSPYNLYLHKGLPPTAIANPGLDAIVSTIQASSSPYWFYLSGTDGRMHYARDYDGHLANKAKYIK